MTGVSSSSSFWILPASAFCASRSSARDVAGRQRVVVLVLEVRRVPGAVALQRRGEIDVRHAAMAIVGDAHHRIQPVRFAEHRVAVIGALVEDVEFELDTDLLDPVLDQLRVFGDFQIALGGQRHLEALADAGRFHQLLGLRDVLLALRHARVGRGIDRRERAVVAERRASLHQAGGQLLAVEAERDGTAHARILERIVIAAHVQLLMRRRLQADDVDVRIVEQGRRPTAPASG